ncbi:hypothetical protein ADIAG_01045 [Paeniglutamicibacter gangotriensis Lz1y]|uniref:Uncharacterized protein n=1 Tax=Paeniglutamicibacter gangotriensis Lz1y TaxID=1276920 RepID=M7NDN8_9MICC|nr:hypothetical protein ADIAG_01045 [Paeniglutamicibacter gangotriensis Lz1y]
MQDFPAENDEGFGMFFRGKKPGARPIFAVRPRGFA